MSEFKDIPEGWFWLTAGALLVALLLGVLVHSRVLPEQSVQCVKAGGQWVHDRAGGHCERAPK